MTSEEILRRVASGELTPEQALPLLDAAAPDDETADPAAAPDEATLHEPAPSWGSASDDLEASAESAASSVTDTSTGPVNSIRIHAAYRNVDVIADPSVTQLVVTGTHTVRREGDVMIVESQDTPFSEGFPRGNGPGFSFADLPRGLAWAKSWAEQRLVVRVNPELAVDVECSGANLKVSGLSGGVRLRVIAVAVKLERLRGRIDLEAITSSVKGSVIPIADSRITAESSSVKLLLDGGSDVTVTAHNRMGKVILPQGISVPMEPAEEQVRATVGAGRHRLEVEARMSSVTLSTDSIGAAA